jgi:hypothetical protein
MKIIAGFDCAVSNLGICYIEYDDEWHNKVAKFILDLDQLYKTINQYNKTQLLNTIQIIIQKINDFVINIVSIKYFNVIDLIPGYKINKVPLMERTRNLKYLLCCLDQQLSRPDIVLIEYQMKQNDISRAISHQISYHYITTNVNVFMEYKEQFIKKSSINNPNSITYAIDSYPIHSVLMNDNNSSIIVETVGTTLKNAYHIAPGGEYSNFIVNFSNYVANKKHTDYNFKYYIKQFMHNKYDELISISNKTNDIADAFMMIFNWLKKKDLV